MSISFNKEYLGTPTGMMKVIEIVFTLVAFGIFRGMPLTLRTDHAAYFADGILVACMIVTPLLLVSYLLGRTEIQQTTLEVSFNSIMGIFYLASSIDTLVYYADPDYLLDDSAAGLAFGSFCLMDSIAYLVDAFFSGKIFKENFSGFG